MKHPIKRVLARERGNADRRLTLLGGLFFALFFSFLFSLSIFFCPQAVAEESDDSDFTYDILSMIQLNPDFSTYPGSDGVIWLKRIDYGMGLHGGIERKSLWILLGRKGVDSRWLLWNVPVPQGGEAEILEASVYSPRSGEKIMSAEETQKGDMWSAAFTHLPEEFILVVSYRELFPERLSVEDLVWLSETLPVWESAVQVTVPAGHSFYYSSNTDAAPKASNVDSRMIYEWTVINTTADLPFPLRDEPRRYVAFSSREGREAAARSIKTLETASIPKPPSEAEKLMGKQHPIEGKALENFLKWLYEQPELILPDGASRKIPEQAPWTRWEKLLLAHDWLKNRGVRLFWRLAYPPAADKPACSAMAVAPVLEISGTDPKKGAFYYTLEQAPRMRENSVSLWGRKIYGITPDGGLEERKISDSSASANRLSLNFNLTLDKDGIMSGTLRIVERNAWRRFLLPSDPTEEALASLVKDLFPRLPRYRDVTFKDSGSEHEVRMVLTETQIIKSPEGHNFLVTVPSLIPSWFKSLSSGPFPYTLRFPFIMEARFDLALPDSTANVILPTPTGRNRGKIKFTESYKLSKKKVLTAEARMTVGETVIADENAADLSAVLQNWQAFMVRHLPVQLKTK
ncbi:MAG: hypothetical protein LBP21_11735 [Synergistaceae bacterium]|jgi:hypothetical protein|nr:hypothetical protein [Synergistaceae bacterium]